MSTIETSNKSSSFESGPNGTPKAYISSEVILFIMGLFGIALNVCVLYVVFVRKKAPIASDTVLIGLIAISDLIVCSFTIVLQPLIAFGLAENLDVRCWSDTLIFSTSSFTSLSITSILSFVRYLSLVRGWEISWKKSLFGSLTFLILVWAIIISRGLLSGLYVMPSGLYCMPRMDTSNGINIANEVIYSLLLLPCPFIIIFCYAAVGFRYHEIAEKSANAAVRSTCSELGSLPTIQSIMRKSFGSFHRKRLMRLGIVVLSYIIALIPEYVLSFYILFLNSSRTSLQDTVAFMFTFLLAIINPIFVLHLYEASDT